MADEKDVVSGSPIDAKIEPAKKEEKPTNTPPANEPKVEMVEVDVGGVKAMVPKVFVDEYRKMQTAVVTAETKVKAAAKTTEKVDDADDPLAGIDVELFSDPKAAVAKIIKVANERAVEQIAAEQANAKARDEFWTEFYKQNKDLDRETDGEVITVIMQRDYAELKDLMVPEAIKKLAEKSRTALLKIAEKRGKSTSGKPVAEGGNEPSGPGSKKTDVSTRQPGSLSSIISERRAARLKSGK